MSSSRPALLSHVRYLDHQSSGSAGNVLRCVASKVSDGLRLFDGDAERNPFRHLAEEGKVAMDHHGSNRARAAEATNRRFFGDGKMPYTPPKEAPKF